MVNDICYTAALGNAKISPVIYSEEEREIGVWIDGKPLYQRTIVGTLDGSSPYTFFVGATYDVDAYVSVEIKIISNNSANHYEFLSTGYVNSNNYVGVYNEGGTDKNLKLYYNTGSYGSGSTYYATIRYTKTTDTAGSGIWTPSGIPAVHYSEEEQVVGTWIDGKTLYQKTVATGGSVPSGATLIERIVQTGYDTIRYTKTT